MKVKCIVDIPYFTKGFVYDVDYVDTEGDIWVLADDQGDKMFLYPDECEDYHE